MNNEKGISFPEVLAVASIILLIAAAFFSITPQLITNSQQSLEAYMEKILMETAQRYLSQHGFQANLEDKGQMLLYLWEKDGTPSIEEAEGLQLSPYLGRGQSEKLAWLPQVRQDYLGVLITEERIVHNKRYYHFEVVVKERAK